MSTTVLIESPLGTVVDVPPAGDAREVAEPTVDLEQITSVGPNDNTHDSAAGETPGGVGAVLPKLVAKYLDARELIDDPKNLRKNLRESLGLTPESLPDDDPDFGELRTLVDGDLEKLPVGVQKLAELKASIEEVGVLQPLVVIPTSDLGGAWQIVMGHRRKYASILVKRFQVPCLLATDYDEAKRIVAQLVENTHRVGLTASEEADGFTQLTLLNWSTERIAKVRGVPEEAVLRSLKLRTMPANITEAVDTGQLTLEEAAELDTLADHPSALNKVLKAQAGWSRRHVIASELAKIAATKAKERAKAELVLAGVKVTGKPAGFGYTSNETDIGQLVDAENQPLDPEIVRTMPGFAAFVEKQGSGARTVVYCTDPQKLGYHKLERNPARQLSAEELTAQVERERAQAAYLAELDVAKGIRRQFITTTYGTARGSRRLYVAALRQTLARVHQIPFAALDGLYTDLGGCTEEVLATAGEDRLRRSLIARWICSQEHNVDRSTDGRTWYFDRTAVTDWYAQLVADGYPLADAERQRLDSLTPTSADEHHHDENEDADQDGVEDEHGTHPFGTDEATEQPAQVHRPDGERLPNDTFDNEPEEATIATG